MSRIDKSQRLTWEQWTCGHGDFVSMDAGDGEWLHHCSICLMHWWTP
jgi:hypothetical protein